MGKTLLALVNGGLKVIGEPEITAFTATNILQERLIEAANEAKDEIAALMDFEWGNKHTTFTTTAKITDGKIEITNGSNLVTSVDSDGVDAANFTNVTADMWLRKDGDKQSYAVSSVATGSTPHVITLKEEYVGTTSATGAYTVLQDTFDITDSDFDRPRAISFTDPQSAMVGVSGQVAEKSIQWVNFGEIYSRCGGDFHANTSGLPAYAARISADADENSRIILWPYPATKKIVDLWYFILWTDASVTTSDPFGGGAPSQAYQAIGYYVKADACQWDKQYTDEQRWMSQYQNALKGLVRRENLDAQSTGMQVQTYRRRYSQRYPARSGILFDYKGARR